MTPGIPASPESNTRLDRSRGGMIAVMGVFCLLVLLGVLAVVLDGGTLMDEQQHAQAVADSAAMAAAADLFKNWLTNAGVDTGGTAKAAALALAKDNGYANDGTTTKVVVNIPPKNANTKTFNGLNGYAEVTVTYNQPRYFSSLWGSGTIPVSAHAIARGLWTQGSYGVISLSKTSNEGAIVNGKLILANNGAPTGKMAIASNNATALNVGLIGNITGAEIDVNGSVNNTVGPNAINATLKSSLSGTSNQINITDPLANIPEPAPSGTNFGKQNISGTATMNPGIYTNINIAAGASVTMNPGVYFIQGSGLTLGSGATLSGAGVMLFNQSGDHVDFSNGGAVNITPPTSGAYSGISYWQPRNDATEVHVTSNKNITMPGTFYARSGVFDFWANGSAVFKFGNYISDTLEVNQFANTGTVYLDSAQGAATQQDFRLVE